MLLHLYRAAGRIIFPFIKERLRRGREEDFDERLGVVDAKKLEAIDRSRASGVLWLHAVSVGEAQAASSIVRAARDEGFRGAIVMTTVTATGARVVDDLVGDLITARIFAPWDVAPIVRKFVDAIRPDVYVSVETEIWPALLSELGRRGARRALVNARASDRSWARRGAIRAARSIGYGLFDFVSARGEEDARRLREMGAANVSALGDLKIDAIARRRDLAKNDLDEMRRILGLSREDRVLVAGSTHEGEDEVVLDAYAKLDGAPMLVIVPRHPERAEKVFSLASAIAPTELFSKMRDAASGEKNFFPGDRPRIVVVDVIGVQYALYGLAISAFVGGSIAPKGGQNIVEPASWGIVALHGPHMEDFAAPTEELDAAGGAKQIFSSDEIAAVWQDLIESPQKEHDNESKSFDYFEKNLGASARIWRAIKDMLGGR